MPDYMLKRRIGFCNDAHAEQWDLDISDDALHWTGVIRLQPDSNDIDITVWLDDKFPFTAPSIYFTPGQLQHPRINDVGCLDDIWHKEWSPACQRLPTIMWTVLGVLNDTSTAPLSDSSSWSEFSGSDDDSLGFSDSESTGCSSNHGSGCNSNHGSGKHSSDSSSSDDDDDDDDGDVDDTAAADDCHGGSTT
jgi:ubiquitin-protein ligase